MARLRSPDFAASELRRNLAVVNALGVVTLIFGATMAFPMLISWWTGDGAVFAYDVAMLVTCGVGGIAWLATSRYKRELEVRDAFLLVVLVWTVLPAFATLPLLRMIDGLSFTDAYFETVSGITTTGATVLTGLGCAVVAAGVMRGLSRRRGRSDDTASAVQQVAEAACLIGMLAVLEAADLDTETDDSDS
jgi:Trk-type K+ transport system membrane component